MTKEEAKALAEEDQLKLALPLQIVEIARYPIENNSLPKEAIIYGNLKQWDAEQFTDANYYCVSFLVRVEVSYWFRNTLCESLELVQALRITNDYKEPV